MGITIKWIDKEESEKKMEKEEFIRSLFPLAFELAMLAALLLLETTNRPIAIMGVPARSILLVMLSIGVVLFAIINLVYYVYKNIKYPRDIPIKIIAFIHIIFVLIVVTEAVSAYLFIDRLLNIF